MDPSCPRFFAAGSGPLKTSHTTQPRPHMSRDHGWAILRLEMSVTSGGSYLEGKEMLVETRTNVTLGRSHAQGKSLGVRLRMSRILLLKLNFVLPGGRLH